MKPPTTQTRERSILEPDLSLTIALQQELGVQDLSMSFDNNPDHDQEFKGYAVKDRGLMGADERNTTHNFRSLFVSWRREGKRYGIHVRPENFVEQQDYDFVGEGISDAYPVLLTYNFRGVRYDVSMHKLVEFLKEKINP